MADKKEDTNTNVSKSLAFYQEPGNLKKLCDFLRSRQGPALREAVLMDQRVYYIKGMSLTFVVGDMERVDGLVVRHEQT